MRDFTLASRPIVRAPTNELRPVPLTPIVARTTLVAAPVIGLLGDALLRDGFSGPGFGLFIAIATMALVALVWKGGRSLTAGAVRWLAVAAAFAAMLAWRDAGALQFLDVVATAFAMLMAASASRDPLYFAPGAPVLHAVRTARTIILAIAAGAVPLALRLRIEAAGKSTRGSRLMQGIRPAAIAIVIAMTFGALLRSADPIFASLVSLPEIEVETLMSHVFLTGFFAWIFSGWARGAIEEDTPAPLSASATPIATRLDTIASLGTLNVLFGVYVLAQLGWFFGGESFLRDRTGLTVAEYARRGFFEMVWVVMLVVPVLVATRITLPRKRRAARLHARLTVPLLVMLGIMIGSAALRMRLYVNYFGLTVDRFDTLVFMGWLALVLAWLSVTVLRDRLRPFVGGAVISGLVVLVGLNVISPDRTVALVNVARANGPSRSTVPTLDLKHLTYLSAEAADVALGALLSKPVGAPGSMLRLRDDFQRCGAIRNFRQQWGAGSAVENSFHEPAAWKNWNFGQRRAVALTRSKSHDMAKVQHDVCSRVSPEQRKMLEKESYPR